MMMTKTIRLVSILLQIASLAIFHLQGESFAIFDCRRAVRNHVKQPVFTRPIGTMLSSGLPEVLKVENANSQNDEKSNKFEQYRKAIVVSTDMELDVPIEVAYDAFADLTRQPSWAPWLKSVEYIGSELDIPRQSLWKLNYLGIRVSWKAVSTKMDRPYSIAWESINGLKNYGQVEFEMLENKRTRMKITLSFLVPRLAVRVIGQHGAISRMVENKMLKTMMRNFQTEVVNSDMVQSGQFLK